MNVTNNGYYSTNYLDSRRKNHNQQQFKARKSINDIFVKNVEDAEEETKRFGGLFKRKSNKGVPYTSIRIRMSSQESSVGGSESLDGKSSKTNSEYITHSVNDPDYLEEGINPADLVFMQKNHSNGRRKKKYLADGVFESNGFSGYYINQKKKNDITPIDMKNYTHKTFKEVFEDKQFNDRYNPAECVFSEGKEGTFKNKLKALNLKIGRDKYKNYDYYENLNVNSHNSEHSSVKDVSETKTIQSSMKGPGSIIAEPIVIEPDDEDKVQETEASTEEMDGKEKENEQNPDVNEYSIWNFLGTILSYASGYENNNPFNQNNISSNENPKPSNESITFSENNSLITQDKASTSPTSSEKSEKALKVLKKNYKDLVSRWNQPVSTIWKEVDVQQQEITPYVQEEFIIELDDDKDTEEDIHEELYYDPRTRQLVKSPPEQEVFNEQRFNPKGGILSHFCQLIKTIKIMKLIFTPIDIIGEAFPNLQTLVIIIELIIFLWILYEISLLIDALCMMVKAFCAPMIALGRFMNRII